MLGLDNPIHIVFVLVVLLLVFGAKRLPEMGKSMGEGLRGFKESISGEHTHHGINVDHTEADHSPVRVDELTAATPAPTTAETADRTPVHAA
jgi:sec-independent protein translocase protein TatA